MIHNAGPERRFRMTIYETMKKRLGREPTNEELRNEVKRILEEAAIERKSKR